MKFFNKQVTDSESISTFIRKPFNVVLELTNKGKTLSYQHALFLILFLIHI